MNFFDKKRQEIVLSLFDASCSTTHPICYPLLVACLYPETLEFGWLPTLIPKSSNDIKTSNNFDINTSNGEFYCDTSENIIFLVHLWNSIGHKAPITRWTEYVTRNKSRKDTRHLNIQMGIHSGCFLWIPKMAMVVMRCDFYGWRMTERRHR